MIDLSRIPTARESDYLRKRGRRDAMKFCGTKADEFNSVFADEAAKVYKSVCESIRVEFEGQIAQFENAHETATDDMQRANKALADMQKPALPSGNETNSDYQGEYRSKLKREAFEDKKTKASGAAQHAKSSAESARIRAMSAIVYYRDHVICWMRPYCEGIYSVNPVLIEKLRPYDMPNMFGGDDPFGFIEKSSGRHPSLFGGPGAAKSLEASSDEPKALGEAASVIGFDKIKDIKEQAYV